MVSAATVAMLLANDVWAVYGIAVGVENPHGEFEPNPMARADEMNTESVPFETPSVMTPSQKLSQAVSTDTVATPLDINQPSVTTTAPSVASTSSMPSLLSTPIPTSTTAPVEDLETGVKIGIGVVAGFVGIALILILIELCYLRRRRQEKALQRAVEEVESRERALNKDSEEIVVLESRISIHFDDASSDEDDDTEQQERGRNGMSLPRREY
ncbi:hypothetical protein N0V90_005975 [Kalmusia sp. IMI 367209]|nr:hypothetical protein N0V90_005975 [Kalmusia sp. IMI 367209]